MKAALGLVSLLVVLGVLSLLVKKQLPASNQPAAQSTQAQQAAPQQIKQQLDAAMKQPREIPQDK